MRDTLIKSSSEYVKLCDVNLMLGALEKEISVLKALVEKNTDLETDGNLFEIVSTFETFLKTSGAAEAAVMVMVLD